MRKALIYTIMMLLSVTVSAQGKIVQAGPSLIEQVQQRDSILIADHLFYGFELSQVEEGTQFAFPQIRDTLMTNMRIVNQWRMDTVKVTKQKKGMPRLLDIKAGMIITSFDEGLYELPQIVLQRQSKDGVVDTLYYEPMRLEFKTMPVDTATFVPHDIKGQIRYPVTMAEVLPWFAAVQWVVVLIILGVCLYIMYRKKGEIFVRPKEPAHIVALRELDKYRGKDMWAPQKQKAFYSGITDALREYISERYDVGAMEMTTAEIFEDMKRTDAPAELLAEVKQLFELADFVKFAKFVASDEDNAAALPVAVRFVTQTYHSQIEEEKRNKETE